MMRTTFALSLFLSHAAACDMDLSLESPGTSITATAAGDGTTGVVICAGPRGLLDCNTAETFTVALDGVEVEARLPLFSFGQQYAWFEVGEPGSEVLVTRHRDGATARVTLPEEFELEVRQDGDVELRWSPSGTEDPVRWTAIRDCDGGFSASYGDDEDDDGASSIDRDELPESSGSCGDAVSIELARQREGTLSAGFEEESTIAGRQVRQARL
jgi:hypothetical protein